MTNKNIENVKEAARELSIKATEQGFKPQALHDYTDRNGSAIFWRVRLKHPETGEKWIRPMKHDGETFALGEPPFPSGKPLYRLHKLVERDAMVWIVEGETCVEVLEKAGVIATTSGAADSAQKADWSILAGRAVTIWPDNDEAGQRFGDAVTEILRASACTVRLVDVAALNLPPKGDVVDWLKMHPNATPVDLERLPIVASQEASKSAATSNSVPDADQQAIEQLAALSPLEYDRARKTAAVALGVRPVTLDRLVTTTRKEETDTGLSSDDIEPWPHSIDPAMLLTEISTTVQRFIVCQRETADAVALWAAMTWFIDEVQVSPLAIITAPEKRCGKSQLLFLLGRLSYRPLTASNITPAALFRAIDAWRPTLLVDEADAFLRENEELRGLLNCGHTRDSAYIVRVVGDDHTPRKFNVWGAKAIAGIGHLADTLMDRAILLELRRKLPHEQVERLRHAEPELFDNLAAKLARFAEDYRDAVRKTRPELPPSLNDRAQDNWEPLLAIAEVAGGQWLALARDAALKLSGADSQPMTTGTELLSDIREIFDTKRVDRITTGELLTALCDDDERPWATYNRGKSIAPRQLAKRLAEYGIKSATIRVGNNTAKGYQRGWFNEAFLRYLSLPPVTSVTASQSNNDKALRVTDRSSVTVTDPHSVTLRPAPMLDCYAVTDKNRGNRENIVEVEI